MIGENAGIAAFQTQINVSRETLERLETYEGLLRKWNPTINLVSKTTLSETWTRHFLDSAQLWAMRPDSAKRWLDLGSGGGFPGLVIGVLAAEHQPDLTVTLVESDARKASFLLNTAKNMGLDNITVYIERAEALKPQGADVISARALAQVDTLLHYADLHLAENGVCLFCKGANHEMELTEARKCWTFKLQKSKSLSDPTGIILQIESIHRVRAQE